MKNRQKDITTFSVPSLIISVLAWVFTPKDLFFSEYTFVPKIALVIVIISLGISGLLAKWLLEKKKQMKDDKEEYDRELKEVHFQLENLQCELKGEKSKYSIHELNTNQTIEQLREKIRKIENEQSSAISVKDAQIKNLEEINKFHEDQIEELKAKNKQLESTSLEKFERLQKENKQIEKAKNKIKEELASAQEEIVSLRKTNSLDNIPSWRHNVLIVDDNATVIKNIKSRLKEIPNDIDIVYLKRLEDYRLVENFEIIICDILRCSPGENATLLLNKIKEHYPYKFVFAMSTTPAECNGLNVDGDIIQKDNTGVQYIKVIKKRIVECIEKLDDPKSYWEQVQNTYLLKYLRRPKKIESFRNAYIATLKRLAQSSVNGNVN